MVICVLARGHMLLEGLPGLGKTELVKRCLDCSGCSSGACSSRRICCPATSPARRCSKSATARRSLVFHRGPIFANLVLADEINRAPPKTQSALLEAMQERQVTVAGDTHPLPDPVLRAGDAESDRAGRDVSAARSAARSVHVQDQRARRLHRDAAADHHHPPHGRPPELDVVLSGEELTRLFDLTDRVHLPEAVSNYIARLCHRDAFRQSRPPEEVRRFVRYGASPRAAIAWSAPHGRRRCFGESRTSASTTSAASLRALVHRLILDYAARLEGWTPERVGVAPSGGCPGRGRGLRAGSPGSDA